MVFDRKCIKSSLKYASIVLGFIIMTGVFYLSITEVTQKELITINNPSSKILNTNIVEEFSIDTNPENCNEENLQYQYIPDLIVKSALAFLAGCIISEKKFFRFGII